MKGQEDNSSSPMGEISGGQGENYQLIVRSQGFSVRLSRLRVWQGMEGPSNRNRLTDHRNEESDTRLNMRSTDGLKKISLG